jgi:hypothetical protein
LTATGANARVALSWPASIGASSYTVQRALVSGGPYVTVGCPTTPSYTDAGLTNGTTYYYVVSAAYTGGQDGGGGSTNSPEASATPRPIAMIWPSNPTPAIVDSNDTDAVELGVKFRSDDAGAITGLRFYKSAANTGTHIGHLWSLGGVQLGSVTFTGETASGWQQMNFATPVAIQANTVYVASYFAPNGRYSTTLDYFATQGVDTPPLHALADGVSGGNGVYAYGAASSFPTNTFRTASYWVDVLFSLQSVWPSTTVPGVVDSGPDNAVQLGVKFRSDVAGFVTGIRFYKSAANTGTHVGSLWSTTGTSLATATFTGETASGWQQVTFSSPVAIAANTVYVASYYAPTGHYSFDANYFATQGVDAPPLHLPASGAVGGNGVFAYGASSVFPNNSSSAANYWVDVVFTATTTAGCR